MELNDIETREFWGILPNKKGIISEQITPAFLTGLHDISFFDALDLIRFCKEKTIIYTECYGDGSIMFPLWQKSLEN